MRKTLLAALTLTATAVSAQDYWCLNRVVTITTEYAYLRRQELRDLRLAEEVPAVQFINQSLKGKKVLDTDDLEDRLNWQSGIRGGLTIHGTECASIELLYTYVYPWEATTTVRAKPGNVLRFPFKDHLISEDYNRATEVDSSYKSWLQNGEFNYWGHVTPQRCNYFSFSWNLGFRSMWLKEDFEMTFSRPGSASDYSIETNNVLYGIQLGAMLEMNPDACWTWTFMLKGAGFFNVAKNEVLILDDNNTFVLRDYTKHKWTDSWLLEGYGQLAYHFGRYVSIHFGYQGYILTGVALAPAQRDVSVNSHRRINDSGQIVIDGMYAGIDLDF